MTSESSSRHETGSQLQLQREQIIEQLYNQKEFAFHFGKYLQDLWRSLSSLSEDIVEELSVKIGRERVAGIMTGDVKPSYDDNIALMDVIPDNLRKEMYKGVELKPKKKEFYKRKRREMNGLVQIVDEVSGSQIVDIAGGAGDMARVLSALTKKPAIVLDNNPHQVQYAHELNQILKQDVQPREFDIRNDKIPEGTWVAKHPCGDLADHIVSQWMDNDGSPELYLMTCCQGRAKKLNNPYGFSKEDWQQLCKESDLTNSKNEEQRKKGEEAMRKLDQARVDYLISHGFNAQLKQVKDTVKGNVIVVKR